jgi:hypothetical protein
MADRSSKARPRDPNQLVHQIFLESIGEVPKFDPSQPVAKPVDANKKRSQIAAKTAKKRWEKTK